MTRQKEQYLLEKYPKVFPPEEIRNNVTKSCMAFGFECSDGWFDIIEECLRDLSKLPEPPTLLQVKEKFGTLRIYVDGYTDEDDAIISRAEKKSENTCEMCGKVGHIRGAHWYMVRCDDCVTRQYE